jgi:hypothetical protein
VEDRVTVTLGTTDSGLLINPDDPTADKQKRLILNLSIDKFALKDAVSGFFTLDLLSEVIDIDMAPLWVRFMFDP